MTPMKREDFVNEDLVSSVNGVRMSCLNVGTMPMDVTTTGPGVKVMVFDPSY